MKTKVRVAVSCFAIAAIAGAAAGQAQALDKATPQHEGECEFDTVYCCSPDEHGRLSGGKLRLAIDRSAEHGPQLHANYETLTPHDRSSTNRINLVFVGDGYTAGELGAYAQQVDNLVSAFLGKEPFITYGPFFAIHRVDVVSNVSGVSHDPFYPTWRNTPLQMEFWCNNIERLLCVNVGLAYNYANNAPKVDLVAAIANASKYGGAGYISSNLATASGRNFWSAEVLLHEFGHALGNLADEYDYNGGSTYSGAERPEPNVSIRNASQMAQQGSKWAAWLGVNNPQFDGLIGTYQGAYYHQYGVHRPTNNSIMRALNRPFNLPSIEATLIEMYKIVRPIEDGSPVGPIYTQADQLWVQPVELNGRSLSVQWILDNVPIPGANDTTLNLGTLNLSGEHTVRVVVKDDTNWVRNEAARTQWMTQSRSYSIVAESCYANCDGSTVEPALNVDDFTCFINQFAAAQQLPPNEQVIHYANCDGSTVAPVLNVDDFTCFINAFAQGCQ